MLATQRKQRMQHGIGGRRLDQTSKSNWRAKMKPIATTLEDAVWKRWGILLWHRCQTPRRVRHEFQVDERRLNRRVPQPPTQIIDWDAVHQQVPAQRVRADPLPRRNRAKFLSALHRSLHPTPCGRGMRLDDSALANIPTGQGAAPCSSGCTGCTASTAMIPYGPSGTGSDPISQLAQMSSNGSVDPFPGWPIKCQRLR